MSHNRGSKSHSGGREKGPKRQRLMDQGSSYYGDSGGYGAPYGATPGSTYMYNPTPYSGYVTHLPPFPVVRLRGLPFNCTETDIQDFLRGLDLVDILFIHKGGRFSGEAFCVLGYPMQVDFALQRNKQNMGRRYVEVFRSKRQEYYKAISYEVSEGRNSSGGASPRRGSRAKSYDEGKENLEHTGILRLRGLPYSARREDIKNFFKDFKVGDDSIHVTYNSSGRPSGEAFVEFSSPEESRAAMVKDKKTIGSRYVELFPASREEMDEEIAKGRAKSQDDLNEPVKHTGILKLRGLPFSATKEDIIEFFNGFILSEETIHITSLSNGRPTGEAFVKFKSVEDSESAMEKDRKTLGNRYIELFPSSEEDLDEALLKGK